MRPIACLVLALVALPGCDTGPRDQAAGPSPYVPAPITSPAPLPVMSVAPWEPTTISTADLNARLAAHEAMYVADVRSLTAYEKEHIKGAKSLPWADIDKQKGTLPKGKPIVLYCA